MKAFAVVRMVGGLPDIGDLPCRGYALAAHLPDYSWGIYLFAGTVAELTAINALPQVYRVCTAAEYDTVISETRRARINKWLVARGWPTVPAGWTYRAVLRAAVRRLGDAAWTEGRVEVNDG